MTEILPDIPRFVTALAEWLSCVLYISLLPKRPGRFLLGVLLLAGLGAMLGLHQLAGTWPQPFWVLGMLAAFATMFTLIALTTRIGLRDSGYVAARAFVLAELLASLEWQLRTFSNDGISAGSGHPISAHEPWPSPDPSRPSPSRSAT